MINPSAVVRSCLGDIGSIKRSLEKKSLVSDFDIDYEIRLILFLTAHIDGPVTGSERRFIEQVGRALDWSHMYHGLLVGKIEKQPSYQLESIRIAKAHPELAEVIYKLAYSTALADGILNHDERFFLENLRRYLFAPASLQLAASLDREIENLFQHPPANFAGGAGSPPPPGPTPPPPAPGEGTVEEKDEPADLDACLAELDDLVGLRGVKREIHKLVSFLKIQKKRQEMDLSQTNLSLHMVFTGNPGTGKTTVARLVARIYRALGFLGKGHLVETDRSGLVGQYIGHTDAKTSDVVNRALDGILFIDEAYSLYKASENDFGKEAIDTLVKRMEDHRDRLVVIVAGYIDEMEDFINANPGLRSRFNTYIDFANFGNDELVQIFERMSGANDYQLDPDARKKLARIFEQETKRSGRGFGNGRFARNLFESILRTQALRLSEIKGDLTREDLITIKAQDLVIDDQET